MRYQALLFSLVCPAMFAQVIVGPNPPWPELATAPTHCAAGEKYFDTSTAKERLCTATDTWADMGSGNGSVTTTGTMTNGAIVTSAGGTAIQTICPLCLLDSNGNLSLTGTLSTQVGSGIAGTSFFGQGTLPIFGANGLTIFAPTSIPTAYQWKVPAADAAGAIVSDGAGTPGTLSIKAIQGTDTKLLSSGTVSGTGASLCTDANGGATTSGCSGSGVTAVTHEIAIGFSSTAVLTGQTACNTITYTATITGISLLGDVSGGATLDLQTETFANYLTSGPGGATSITASDTPTFSAVLGFKDTTLTWWSKTISGTAAAPIVVCIVLTSPTNIHTLSGKVTLSGTQ